MKTKKISQNVLLIVSFLFAITNAFAGNCVSWNNNAFQPKANMFGQIKADYGIYWLKNSGNNSESAAPACRSNIGKAQCLQHLKATGYFDPNKPTIIFIHGWQPDTIKNKNRFDLCYRYKQADGSNSPLYNTQSKWQGWNVGVFYWNQFADETNVLSAEAKIYSSKSLNGMRWAYLDSSGQLQYCNRFVSSCIMPKQGFHYQDVLELAYNAYQNALPADYHPAQLRISGQSLGTQIAIQLTDLILHNKALPQPTRLALMDPYFSPDGLENKLQHLPISVADYNEQKIKEIEQIDPTLPIAVYRTSQVSFAPTGNPAPDLMRQIAFMRLYPQFLTGEGDALQAQLHESSIFLYFESMQSPPNDAPGSHSAHYVNAAATNTEVLHLMHKQRYQVLNSASYHFDETDKDIFAKGIPIAPAE